MNSLGEIWCYHQRKPIFYLTEDLTDESTEDLRERVETSDEYLGNEIYELLRRKGLSYADFKSIEAAYQACL